MEIVTDQLKKTKIAIIVVCVEDNFFQAGLLFIFIFLGKKKKKLIWVNFCPTSPTPCPRTPCREPMNG